MTHEKNECQSFRIFFSLSGNVLQSGIASSSLSELMPNPLEPSLPAKMLYDLPWPYTSALRVTSKTSPTIFVHDVFVRAELETKERWRTLDSNIYGFARIAPVEIFELLLGVRIVLRRGEVILWWLHDRLVFLSFALRVFAWCSLRSSSGSTEDKEQRKSEGKTVEDRLEGEQLCHNTDDCARRSDGV
jgi:hypothetical protein